MKTKINDEINAGILACIIRKSHPKARITASGDDLNIDNVDIDMTEFGDMLAQARLETANFVPPKPIDDVGGYQTDDDIQIARFECIN